MASDEPEHRELIVVAANPTSHAIPVTSEVDGREHRVADKEMAVGVVAMTGVYEALCGHRVVAALMVCPPGPPCAGCATFLRARQTLRRLDQRAPHRHRRVGVLVRFLRRNPPTQVAR